LLAAAEALVGTAHHVLEEMVADFLAEQLMVAEELSLQLELKVEMGLKTQVLYKADQLTVEMRAEAAEAAEVTLVVALVQALKEAAEAEAQATGTQHLF
jgi:hypothetical protein